MHVLGCLLSDVHIWPQLQCISFDLGQYSLIVTKFNAKDQTKGKIHTIIKDGDGGYRNMYMAKGRKYVNKEICEGIWVVLCQ